MIFDQIERMLRGVGKYASYHNHPLADLFTLISKRAITTLRTYPTFRLYEHEALINKLNAVGISDEEKEMINRHLPYEEFAVVVHNFGTYFFWQGDPFDCFPDDYVGRPLFCIATLAHSPNAQDDYQFFGPVYMAEDGDGVLDIFTPVPDAVYNNDEAELYEEANKVMVTASTMLFILSICRNQVISCKTPYGLIKKRVKRGKYPQYEYKILTLDATAVKQLPTLQREQVTGRLSPRTHTRRGHVRRNANGKVIWIRSSVINAPYYADGLIVKDYEVIGS